MDNIYAAIIGGLFTLFATVLAHLLTTRNIRSKGIVESDDIRSGHIELARFYILEFERFFNSFIYREILAISLVLLLLSLIIKGFVSFGYYDVILSIPFYMFQFTLLFQVLRESQLLSLLKKAELNINEINSLNKESESLKSGYRIRKLLKKCI